MTVDDDTLERMARAHDRADAAQLGEPESFDPWAELDLNSEIDREWRAMRIAAMRAAVEVMEGDNELD